jgi:hypothetical protein
MTIQNAPGFATKSKPQGFAPSPKSDRAAASTEPADHASVTQSEALTVRESVNLTAGTGARALQALTAQREQTQETIAAEIERLTDPDLFFAETMNRAAEKIRQRQQSRDQVAFELDFFDPASVTALLPKPRQLPQVWTGKQLSAAG